MAGRPKTYLNAEERKIAARPTSALIMEILEVSGLKSEALAETLRPHIDLSGTMIRQYKRRLKVASPQRLAQIALGATKCGWVGPNIKSALNLMPDWGSKEEFHAWRRESRRALRNAETTALRQLKSSLFCLADKGWSDTDMVAATIAITKQIISPENLTGGGLVDYRQILNKLNVALTDELDQAWIDWQIHAFAKNTLNDFPSEE